MTEYMSLEHGSTVVVVEDTSELFYLIKWMERSGKTVSEFFVDINEFPFCISVCGPIAGWTIRMDRALYYKSFAEFLSDIKGEA